MKSFTIFGLLAVMAVANDTSKAEASDPIEATTRQRIHPILIRRDFNPLLQVRIEAKQKAVFLSSIMFSLEGTDDLADVESLQVFLNRPHETINHTAIDFYRL